MVAKILLAGIAVGIIVFLGWQFMKKNNSVEYTYIDLPNDLPVVKTVDDVKKYAEKEVYISGIYELKDMRMRRENPKELFKGHVEIVLEDNYSVVLMPPDHEEAIRPTEEQTRCKGKKVCAKGVVYPYIPSGKSNLKSPCLIDITSIELLR